MPACSLVPRFPRRSLVRMHAAATLAAVLGAAVTAAARPMTVEDLWSVQRVGTPSVSPDGKWIAFGVTTWSMTDNKSSSDLWLVSTGGRDEPRRLTWNKGPDSSPVWSPDGTRLAYVSKRGDDPAQLFLLSFAGGEPEQVTELPVAVADPRWFPDGKRIAFVATTWPGVDGDFAALKKRLEEQKNDKTRAQQSESRLFRYWDHPLTDGQVAHLFAVDLETRAVTDLLPGSRRVLSLEDPTWDLSPDGTEIAFTANATEPPHRTLDQDVFVVPVAGGAPRNLTEGHRGDDTEPRYTRDGRFLLFGRTDRADWDPAFTHLVRFDRATGAITDLTRDWDGSASGWRATHDSRSVLFHAQNRGRTHLYAVPIAGGTPRLVVRGGHTRGVQATPDGVLVFGSETMTTPAEIWSARWSGGTARDVRPRTRFNQQLAKDLDWPVVRDVTFTGAGGDSVQMFVVVPHGAGRGQRYPLFHALHGGPHGAWLDQFHYRWNAALLASRGHVVSLVNFHGSTGAGQSFAESIVGAHGDKPFTDVMRATDWLIASGLVDSTRMAAGGGSYGGYLTNWILGHTNRFRALVSHAGVYNLMGQFASDVTYGRALNYGAEPWVDPQRIDLWSPNRYAANFATPTLVLHGEKDFRVPVTQGIELYGVLTAKGVPARIVVFPEENHWILKPQASRLWHQELFGWVEKHVGAGPGGGGAATSN